MSLAKQTRHQLTTSIRINQCLYAYAPISSQVFTAKTISHIKLMHFSLTTFHKWFLCDINSTHSLGLDVNDFAYIYLKYAQVYNCLIHNNQNALATIKTRASSLHFTSTPTSTECLISFRRKFHAATRVNIYKVRLFLG